MIYKLSSIFYINKPRNIYSNKNNNNYKINIIKVAQNEENINTNNPNLLSINSQTKKRKKTLQEKMQNSYCIKKYKNESGTGGAKILKELHKAKSLKVMNIKETDSNLEDTSNLGKNSKYEDENKNVSPEKKHNINYNININNSNTNEIFDLLKFTNNLYNGDSHLQKQMPTKKLDINKLSKFDKNFNNDATKIKLFIQFGLKDGKRKSFKSAKYMPRDSNDATNFSNYIKIKQKQRYENDYDNKIDSSEYEDYTNNNKFKKGNYSSKSTKMALFKMGKSKNKKIKKSDSKIIYEQIEQGNEKGNIFLKPMQSIKTKKNSSQSINNKTNKSNKSNKSNISII